MVTMNGLNADKTLQTILIHHHQQKQTIQAHSPTNAAYTVVMSGPNAGKIIQIKPIRPTIKTTRITAPIGTREGMVRERTYQVSQMETKGSFKKTPQADAKMHLPAPNHKCIPKHLPSSNLHPTYRTSIQ